MEGYLQAGNFDQANPYGQIWWVLEPRAEHCSECPQLAAASPYDAPWVQGGNILYNSPGDGQTECGAGCKCSLQYEPPDGNVPSPGLPSVPSWMPEGAPLAVPPSPVGEVPQTTETPSAPSERVPGIQGIGPYGRPIGPEGFNTAQMEALDQYRKAANAWDIIRGGLPELPNFFQLARPSIQINLPPWSQLTQAQQDALRMAAEAYRMWLDTIPVEDLGLYEVERGLLLYGINRDSRGRYTYGKLPRNAQSAKGHGPGNTHGGKGKVHEHAGGIVHEHETVGSGVGRHAQARADKRAAAKAQQEHDISMARRNGGFGHHMTGHTATVQRGNIAIGRQVIRQGAAARRAANPDPHPLARANKVPTHLKDELAHATDNARIAEEHRAQAAKDYLDHVDAHGGHSAHDTRADNLYTRLEAANQMHRDAQVRLQNAKAAVKDFRKQDLAQRRADQLAAQNASVAGHQASAAARAQASAAGHAASAANRAAAQAQAQNAANRAQARAARAARAAQPKMDKPNPVPQAMHDRVQAAKDDVAVKNQEMLDARARYRAMLNAHQGMQYNMSPTARADFQRVSDEYYQKVNLLARAQHEQARAEQAIKDFKKNDLAGRKAKFAREHPTAAAAQANARVAARIGQHAAPAQMAAAVGGRYGRPLTADLNRANAVESGKSKTAAGQVNPANEAVSHHGTVKWVNGQWEGGSAGMAPPFSASSFDTAMKAGNLQRFHEGVNDTGRLRWTDENGVAHDYVIKHISSSMGQDYYGAGGLVAHPGISNAKWEANAEAASAQIGNQLGFDHGVKTYAIEYNGKQYVAGEFNAGYKMPWGNEHEFARLASPETLQGLAIHDYLVGEPDRHGKNYMFNSQGHVLDIDHGRALQIKGNPPGSNAGSSAAVKAWLEKTYDANQALPRYGDVSTAYKAMKFDPALLARASSVATEREVMKTLSQYNLEAIKPYVHARFKALRAVAAQPEPTFLDLQTQRVAHRVH
jgi:hypothetical protein